MHRTNWYKCAHCRQGEHATKMKVRKCKQKSDRSKLMRDFFPFPTPITTTATSDLLYMPIVNIDSKPKIINIQVYWEESKE